MDTKEMTYIELVDDEGVWNCNNCGAYQVVKYGNQPTDIKHYKSCIPGEAVYWEKFYEENPD